jgi:hypothetical protein
MEKSAIPTWLRDDTGEAIAREIGYRPTDVKNRVQQIVDAMVTNRA